MSTDAGFERWWETDESDASKLHSNPYLAAKIVWDAALTAVEAAGIEVASANGVSYGQAMQYRDFLREAVAKVRAGTTEQAS